MWHNGWHPRETRNPAAGCVPTGSLTPTPNPSMQSLALPTTVAWQLDIYLKGRPHSNAYYQPALPAWRKPLSSFWLPHPQRHTALPVPGPQVHSKPIIHFPETLKALGVRGQHFGNCTFLAGWRAAAMYTDPASLPSSKASCAQDSLAAICGHRCTDPRFRYANEAGPPELLGYWELCVEVMARVSTKAQLEAYTPVDNI